MIKIISSTFSDHKGQKMKIEINNRRKAGKFTNIWKLTNSGSKKKSKRK